MGCRKPRDSVSHKYKHLIVCMDKLLISVEIISLESCFSEFLLKILMRNASLMMTRLSWMDFFQSCYCCKLSMKEGDPAIYAERAGYEKLWHPACFVCSTCHELLVDMIYFWKNGKLYCGRHYCDSEKPRCAGCDEVCSLRPPACRLIFVSPHGPLTTLRQLLVMRQHELAKHHLLYLYSKKLNEKKTSNFSHSEYCVNCVD